MTDADVKRGRPSLYTPELAAKICERLATGESLKAICRDDDMPAEATVRNWAVNDHEGFFALYAKARDVALDIMADEILEIADTPQEGQRIEVSPTTGTKVVTEDMLGHRRLRIDTRKWYLAKLAPKKYGDKIEHTGAIGSYVMEAPREAESAEDWAKEGSAE